MGDKRRNCRSCQKKPRLRYSVISGVSKKKVIFTKLVKGSVKKGEFIDFMKEIVKRTNNDAVYLMDNARIHKCKELGIMMETIKRRLIYNIPYSPEYNPIEMVFSKVKLMVRKKRTNEKMDKLKKNIMIGFNKITQKDLTGYFDHALKNI